MKKVLELLGKFFTVCAVIFMPLVLLFSSVATNINMNGSVFFTMLVLLLFSALTSISFLLCGALKINVIIKRAIHFILCYGAFFVSFFAIPKKLSDLYTVIVMTLVFILCYSVAGGIKIALCSFMNKKGEDKTYKSIYDVK